MTPPASETMSQPPSQPGGEPAELAAFRAEVRAWIAANKPPLPDFLLPQSFLEVETREQLEYLRAWQRAVYDAGYLGFHVPRAYGGQAPATDPARHAIVEQEVSQAGAPFWVNLIALQWVAPTILAFGTEEQKNRLLPPLLRGDELWCQGFSEPGAGSDLASLTTRAVKVPGGYRVTGHKVWTTLAHFASWMILLARTDSSADKYAGLSYFLFPMDTEGVTIQPLVKMTGEGGFNQVIFEDAFMPDSALLGAEGQGWKIAMATLAFERGASDAAHRDRSRDAERLRSLVELAGALSLDGDGAPVLDDPVARDHLAGLWIEVEAMRLNARRARVPGLCADHPHALALMHKLVFTELNQRMHRLACELLGPEAVLWLGDAHAPEGGEWTRGYLNSYGFTIGGGTSEIQRNILGERVLGLPKSK